MILVGSVPTHFGRSLTLDIPDDADLIVVLVNEGGGWRPINVLLPHQLYEHDVGALLGSLRSYPPWCEVAVAPVRSTEIQTVAKQDPR